MNQHRHHYALITMLTIVMSLCVGCGERRNTSDASFDEEAGETVDARSEQVDEAGTSKDEIDTRSSEDAPRILEFRATRSTLSEGDTITFVVVATDPDGIEDLIGGALLSADGNATYGAFVTSGEEGAYSLSLTWNEIHQVVPIEFTAPVDRRFVAEFFDAAGHRSSKSIDIGLTCDSAPGTNNPACDGVCNRVRCEGACRSPIFDSVEHCGACGNACGDSQSCVVGQCSCRENELMCGGSCVKPSSDDANCGSCGNVCRKNCLDGDCQCDNVYGSKFGNSDCGASEPDCINDETDGSASGECHDLGSPFLSGGKSGELRIVLDGKAVPVCGNPFGALSYERREQQKDTFCELYVAGASRSLDVSGWELTSRYAIGDLALEVDCSNHPNEVPHTPFSDPCSYAIVEVTSTVLCTGLDVTCD